MGRLQSLTRPADGRARLEHVERDFPSQAISGRSRQLNLILVLLFILLHLLNTHCMPDLRLGSEVWTGM